MSVDELSLYSTDNTCTSWLTQTAGWPLRTKCCVKIECVKYPAYPDPQGTGKNSPDKVELTVYYCVSILYVHTKNIHAITPFYV